MQKETFRIFGIPVYSREYSGTTANPSPDFLQALGAVDTNSGVSVNQETALTLSAVWRAVNVVSGTLAFLPLQVFRKVKDGSRENLPTHPAQKVIDNPNTIVTDFVFKQIMHASRMLYGNAYALIIRDSGGYPREFHFLHPDNVYPYVIPEVGMMYRVTGIDYHVPAKDMIHLMSLSKDGIMGRSVIAVQRESLGLAKAAEVYGARFFGSGTNMDGVIEVPGELNEASFKNMSKSWNERYSGLKNSHSTPILEGGAQYKRIGIPPEDAQFLQTRQFQVSEIARWYGVAPHLLFDLSRSTNNNIEHQGMEFVQYTLAPDIAMWESELRRKLFNSSERPTHYCEFNLNALLRGDSKTRAEFYRGMFAVGSMSPNKIRQLENLSPYKGGDRHYVQAGFVPTDKIDEIYNKNTTNEKTTNSPA